MKLIIDISEDVYENVKNKTYCGSLYKYLENGTPLDDITTVIRNKYDSIPWRNTDNDDGWIEALEWSLDVIENILSKAESEDKE